VQTSDSKVLSVFPIVGVGASAGGLEAFRVLLESLPVDTGLAFVIIQHLATSQESMLTDILSRFTSMPVLQVEDGMQVEVNHVYVIPPGSTMTLVNGSLKLHPKGKSLRPIDAFLISLANERKTQAIGVVLSGTGSDGTEGLKAIKAEGGITFAQDLPSSQYQGMPQSAISAETVDFVLSPDNIAKELAKIAKNPQLVRAEISAQEPQTRRETGLQRIFTILKLSFNVDFTHYKESVVNRRITRRMVINHIDNITKYAEFLGAHHTELQALFNDMLIGVTSFFREPNTFQILKETIFPEILKVHVYREPVRIWIPGCSTGEEVYSFAIALQEFLEEKGTGEVQVQIFGTDVNEKNVDKARQGIYPKSIDANVSEARLNKFFNSFNGHFQVSKVIRDMCVFAKQDLTADPPFSNLDLISCRNMLIYFDSHLQERIVPILHYALKVNGFLVLGESESIGKFNSLFEPVNKKNFIYIKKKAQPRVNFGFEPAMTYAGKTVIKEPVKKDDITLLRDEVDRLLISEYVPAAFLINSNLDIIVFRGNVSPYISPESGQTSFNVAKILRKDLRAEAQTAIYRAKKENKPVREEAIQLQYEKHQKTINIQVIPIRSTQYQELFFLLLIEDVSSAAALLSKTIELSATPEGRENVKDSQIQELKDELASSKQSLQTVIETQEVTNEELRSAMEEVQSSNEELQSTNEELETAKEELQSSNEELTTLNDELKDRNQALSRLNDNVENLNKNIDSAVVMVDCDLRIRLFTPSAQKILNFAPSDIGLPISNVHLAITVPDLEKTISEVITSLNIINKEVSDKNARCYELRIRPYIAEGKRVDGAVLSFVDIDVLKKHEDELQVEEEKFRTLTENSPDIIARFDRKLQFLYVNSAVKEMSRISPKDFVGKKTEEIGLPKKFAETWNKALRCVIETCQIEKGEFQFSNLECNQVYQYVVVPEFSVKSHDVETVLSLLKNITEAKRAEENLTKQASLINLSPDAIIVKKLDDTITFWSQGAQNLYGWTKEEAIGKKIGLLMNVEYPEPYKELLNQLKCNGRWSGEKIHQTKSGNKVVVDSRWLATCNPYGEIFEILETNVDITERKRLQLKLEEYNISLEQLVEERTKQLKDSERLAAIGIVAGMVGHDIRNPLQAITGDIYIAKAELDSTLESEEKKNVLESLQEIEKNVDYINKIVADLQDFAKPPKPKIEETDIEQIVNQVFVTLVIPENIKVTYYVEKDFPTLKVDPTYLQRILINLSNNAIQAMSNGGKLTISATRKNSQAVIAVQDTGQGIPENVKSKIFTPLMTTKAKGQGFGLAAVKRFTEAMGGTVTFESEVGKGTKFTVELPG
jgi:PAS domain S-box-containing protein